MSTIERQSIDPELLKRVYFSKGSTFHVSGMLSRYNSPLWSSENLHKMRELEGNIPEVNVWYGIMHRKVIINLDTKSHLSTKIVLS